MFNNVELLLQGFQTALTPTNLLFGLLGTFLGTRTEAGTAPHE